MASDADGATLAVRRRQPEVHLSPAYWAPQQRMDRAVWISAGRRLGRISRCNQWWLGDWLRYGEKHWGETYTAAAKITGYDPRSLANMASIAGTFEASRRRDKLTWSHHAAVASLEVDDQESWLDRATEEKMSVSDLRLELRAAYRIAIAAQAETDEEAAAIICPQCGHKIEVGNES